jgi:hypothetical protein
MLADRKMSSARLASLDFVTGTTIVVDGGYSIR